MDWKKTSLKILIKIVNDRSKEILILLTSAKIRVIYISVLNLMYVGSGMKEISNLKLI